MLCERCFAYKTKRAFVILIEYISVRGNGYDLPRNKLTAPLQSDFRRVFQPAATRNFHANDGDAFYIVIADNLGKFFRVVRVV